MPFVSGYQPSVEPASGALCFGFNSSKILVKPGDTVVVGTAYGKLKAMFDSRSRRVSKAFF